MTWICHLKWIYAGRIVWLLSRVVDLGPLKSESTIRLKVHINFRCLLATKSVHLTVSIEVLIVHSGAYVDSAGVFFL